MFGMNREEAIQLLSWYEESRRVLPWRQEPTPYHVWLSEIMLQQTRIEAVKPYYARFLAACPTIKSLAEAPEEKVLKLWEGLGYYSRAKNLHKAAKEVWERFDGNLPGNPEQLAKLPGIGEYTQKAILAIAFQKPYIAVDGNLLRVYARLNAKRFSAIDQSLKKEAESFFQKAFPLHRPGDYNQALMDLGEIVCLPNGVPLCEECPCKGFCLAHRNGDEASYPGERAKKAKKSGDIDVFLLKKDNRYAIRKRGENGLLAGLYEFPNHQGRTKKAKRKALLEEIGLKVVSETPVGEATHVFTHLIWHMKGYLIEVEGDGEGLLFLTPEEIKERYSIPSAFSYYLNLI